ncbi:MAG: hypothetical protein U1E36_01155 [Rickettsiales bacterium]
MFNRTAALQLALTLPFLLSACDTAPPYANPYGARGAASSVWQNYDARRPVPANLGVPSRTTRYDNYQDNDASYTPPKKFLCTNNLESDFSCE